MSLSGLDAAGDRLGHGSTITTLGVTLHRGSFPCPFCRKTSTKLCAIPTLPFFTDLQECSICNELTVSLLFHRKKQGTAPLIHDVKYCRQSNPAIYRSFAVLVTDDFSFPPFMCHYHSAIPEHGSHKKRDTSRDISCGIREITNT